MIQDNQNNQAKWVAWNPSLRQSTIQFNDFVKWIKQKKSIESANNTAQMNQDLFTEWLDSNDHLVADKCNEAIRMNQAASWAIDYLKSFTDFQDIDFNNYSAWDIINAYGSAFWWKDKIKSYVLDSSNTNCDPTDFYEKMWWSMSEWEEMIERWLWSLYYTPAEAGKNIRDTLLEPFRITSKWVRAWTNAFENMWYDLASDIWLDKLTWRDAQKEKENNSELNAIIQYALDKYTDNWMRWQLTEEEKNQATKDLMDNPELLEEYKNKQNLVNWLTETWLWWTWLTAELGWFWPKAAAVNWLLSVWFNTNLSVPLSYLMMPLSVIAEWVWYVLDETWASKYLDNDTKELVKFFWAWKALWTALTRADPKTWKVEIRPIVKDIVKSVPYLVSEGIEWMRREKEPKWDTTMLWRYGNAQIKTKEQADAIKNLDSETNKIVNSDTIVENKDISKAFAQLDRDELKKLAKNDKVDYEDIFRLNEKEVKSWIKNEDIISETIDKKWGPMNDIWGWDDVTVRWWFRWWFREWDWPNRPIQEFFDKMEIMTRDSSPNMRKALNWYKNRYLAWEIDAQDLLNFKRALSKEYLQYKYKNQGKEVLVSDLDFKRIYDGLNYLIRDAVETIPEFKDMWLWNIMTTLDQRVSPNLNLRTRLITLMNKVNKELWKIPSDIAKRKLTNKMKQATSLWWILRILADFLLDKKEKMTNSLDFQENLPAAIKNINRILKEFPDTERWMIIDSMTEYLKRKYAWTKEVYWWKVEWEVVEEPVFDFIDWDAEFNKNPYLEDYVEIVEPDAPWYNTLGQNEWVWPDLQVPIRVTPEWFAWKAWQTIEWYDNPYQWSVQQIYRDAYESAMDKAWWTPEQKKAALEKLEKVNYKIWQQSLFWEWEIESWPKEKPLLDLKPIIDEIEELEKIENDTKSSIKKAKTSNKSKKMSQEDIDHLFWNDKPKLKKWKKSDK